jgi:hypothetical protein
MLMDIIDKKLALYSEVGLECDQCHKIIKENEEYFVQESSFSRYEKIGDEIREEKVSAWTDKTLCISCKTDFDIAKTKLGNTKVKNHSRSVGIQPYFEVSKINEGLEE